MKPEIATAHERSAYHRFNTNDPLYQFKRHPDEQNAAWEGPSKHYDTFDWLRAEEFKTYNDRKQAQWNKENPDWNKYNPEEDEFLHPNLETTWRNKKPKRRAPKNSAKKPVPKKKNQEEEEDMDSLKVLRKGLGYFVYDPVPKPKYDTEKWILDLSEASKSEDYAPFTSWKERPTSDGIELKRTFRSFGGCPINSRVETPLSTKTTDLLLHFGQKYAKYAKLTDKQKEEMHLFLEVSIFHPSVSKLVSFFICSSPTLAAYRRKGPAY